MSGYTLDRDIVTREKVSVFEQVVEGYCCVEGSCAGISKLIKAKEIEFSK